MTARQHANGDVSVQQRSLTPVEYSIAIADADDSFDPVRKRKRVMHHDNTVFEWDTVLGPEKHRGASSVSIEVAGDRDDPTTVDAAELAGGEGDGSAAGGAEVRDLLHRLPEALRGGAVEITGMTELRASRMAQRGHGEP